MSETPETPENQPTTTPEPSPETVPETVPDAAAPAEVASDPPSESAAEPPSEVASEAASDAPANAEPEADSVTQASPSPVQESAPQVFRGNSAMPDVPGMPDFPGMPAAPSMRISPEPTTRTVDPYDFYDSPLAGRYSSEQMRHYFSPRTRHQTWRRLWTEIARAQRELGLPISHEQIAQMQANIPMPPEAFELAARIEREVRHDVMAHNHAFGAAAPAAAGIIHLGCTSCDITDNADLFIYREALILVHMRLLKVLRQLSEFAATWAHTPALGYTHYQTAQLTTVGKRASLWLYDFYMDAVNLDQFLRNQFLFRGLKGATGTQATFLLLFGGDHRQVMELERKVCAAFKFPGVAPVTGQTYSRKFDAKLVELLSGVACSAAKFANDLRLLSHDQELFEPFGSKQIGSSAMPYKRNPMRCERINSLARALSNLVPNTYDTAQTQWLERTLDDSANRRLTMSEAFLLADAILLLLADVTQGLVVNEQVVRRRVESELPFLASEPILMAGVQAGGDRQELHERLRVMTHDCRRRMNAGEPADLSAELRADSFFGQLPLDDLLDPTNGLHIGRAPAQVKELLTHVIAPYLRQYESVEPPASELAV